MVFMMKTRLIYRNRCLWSLFRIGMVGFLGVQAWGVETPAPPIAHDSKSASESMVEGKSAPETAKQKRIARLIEQLGDKDYFLREEAQEELNKLGFEAFDALSAAVNHDDLEIAARAKYLIRMIRVDWTTPDDPPEVQDLLKDYESLDADNRRIRMRALAQQMDGLGLLALSRLARFEKSILLSKQAAVELLSSSAAAAPPAGKQAEPFRKMLVQSNRPAVCWLQAWLRLAEDPRVLTQQWPALVQAERQILRRAPAQSSPRILAVLMRFPVEQWVKRGETESALSAMRQMIRPENVKGESLQELLDWLLKQKAWPIITELVARSTSQVASDPLLLYTLARSKEEQGNVSLAEQLAGQAFHLNSESEEAQLLQHRRMAYQLNQRGWFRWAKREFEYLLMQKNEEENTLIAWDYAGFLHDHGEDLRAAQVLESQNETMLMQIAIRNHLRIMPPEVRTRKYYYYACHWLSQDNRAKQREALDHAYLVDPNDIEVLIASYHLPGETPEFKRKITAQIQQTATQLREAVAAQPENHSNYNQYAWLIANTEGDLDEALKFSQESLKIVQKTPEAIFFTGGYLDTLARVYYARGNYAAAVKIQTHALELEPSSGQIAKQLELFKKALEEKGP
jgi:tetratricopeptide (TPR) repeat protein